MAKKKRKNSNYRYGMKEEAVKKPQRETGRIVLAIVFGFIFLLASVFFSVAIWYANTFDISFSDLLFTICSVFSLNSLYFSIYPLASVIYRFPVRKRPGQPEPWFYEAADRFPGSGGLWHRLLPDAAGFRIPGPPSPGPAVPWHV